MLKKILIENFVCKASIGVYENEKLKKQKIILNLEITLDKNIDISNDDLNNVSDYGHFRRIIREVIDSKHYNLLETLAEAISVKLKILDKVDKIKLKITKPHAFNDCDVSYQISDYL